METQMQAVFSSSRSVPYYVELGSTSVGDSIQTAKSAVEDAIPGVSAQYVKTCDGQRRQKTLSNEERMQKGLVHNFEPTSSSADGFARPHTTEDENAEFLKMMLEEKLEDFGYMVSSRVLSGTTGAEDLRFEICDAERHLNSNKVLQKRAQQLIASGALKLREEHPLLCALLGHYTELL